MTWLFRLGLLLAVVGAMSSAWPSQAVNRAYAPRVAERTFGRGAAPRVLIDEAHVNLHTMGAGLSPFATLLERDGYRVDAFTAPFSAESLRGCDVLVIVNAFGLRGWLQHSANLLGLERRIDLDVRAFAPDEVRAVEAWVRNGGRLLLVADDALADEAAADLASAFGVRLREWWVEEAEGRDRTTALTHGAGRVVVVGQAPQGNDDPQAVLDLMHWLSALIS